MLDPAGRYAISDSAWAMHLLGLQRSLPRSALRVDDERAADAARGQERRRARAAGGGGCRRRRELRGASSACASRGAPRREIAADLAGFLRAHGHSQVDFTVVGSGPNGANPHHEMGDRTIEDGDMVVLDFGGLKDGYGSDTTRTVHVGEPTTRSARSSRSSAARSRRASRRCARASRARRSTARRAR